MLNVIGLSLFWFVICLLSTFTVWRRIQDDYTEDEAIGMVGLSLVGALVGGKLLALVFRVLGGEEWSAIEDFSGWNVIGLLLGGYVFSLWKHLGRSTWWGDFLDALSEGLVWGVALWTSVTMVVRGNWGDWRFWLLLISAWLGVIAWYWVWSNFRRFFWYTSGKVGFTFWVTWIVIGLFSGIFGFLYDSGWLLLIREMWFILVVGFGVWRLFCLSGRKWKRDWNSLLS